MSEDELPGWRFDIRERSAGVYQGTGTHVSGASVGAAGTDPDELLAQLRRDADELLKP